MGKGDVPARDGPFGIGGGFGGAGAAGGAYAVDLLYATSPPLDADRLGPRVRAFCPRAEAADAGGRPPILFSHKDHLVPVDLPVAAPGDPVPVVPARTVVMPTDRVIDVAALHASLGQTRDWDDAADALARSTARVVVTDLLARDLPPRERLALFEAVLLGVIEAARPAAIHWRPAGKLVDPAALLKASGSPEVDALPQAAINVRLFRVKRSEQARHAEQARPSEQARHADQDLLMDTLGLAALGLPDFQVVFHGMEPARVAGHLYAVALYTLRSGDPVDDGQTIEGPTRGTEWTARLTAAAAEPPRAVVEFDPGPDYSGRAA
jgi:hypothetical protein